MKSILKQLQSESPLIQMEPLKKEANRSKKTIIAGLILTPLVDAFAILVIYLLVQSSDSSKLDELEKDIKLPMASYSQLIKKSFVIKVKDGKFFIKDDQVGEKEIISQLDDYSKIAKEKDELSRLTIIADKNTPYSDLNPLMELSAESGVEKIQFAIIRGEGS